MRRCMSPVVALFGHAAMSKSSQLSGIKRKLDLDPARGCYWREAAAHGWRNWRWKFLVGSSMQHICNTTGLSY